MQRSARFSNSGFTLVEFMIAVVIMTVGLLALLQSVNIAITTNGSTKKRTEAAFVADQAMARVRIMPFANVTTGGLRSTDQYPNSIKSVAAGLGFVNYSVVDTVHKLTTTTKNVRVIVSWREKRVRKEHAVTSVLGSASP